MSLSEKVQQLNREIGSTFERTVSDMRQEVSQWLRSSSEELLGRLSELRPPVPESFVAHEDLEPAVRSEAEGLAEGLSSHARRGGVSDLREALGALDRARSQADILNALLQESGRYASRSAILLLRGGEVRGWAGQGFGGAEVRDVNVGAPEEGVWSRIFQGAGPARLSATECAALCSRLEVAVPREGVLVPLVLRDRVAAALYADSEDGAPLTPDGLQVLCYTAALAIESLPFRERASTATLFPVESPAPGPEVEPEAAPEPPAPEPVAVEETVSDETWTPPPPLSEPEPEPAQEEPLPASAGWESPATTTAAVEVEALAEPYTEPEE
ncbi:MAG TPA: GAF domain-containing protein, partial [Thermoanaerobaculia bacterium]|nr:GAF domain-containing protein [Thermoanaerobaculia bacterium]